jgi:hypothetical protein
MFERQARVYALFALWALVLCACATTPKTTEERLYYADALIRAARDTASNLLDRGQLSSKDARQVQTYADNAKCAVESGKYALGKIPVQPTCDLAAFGKYLPDITKPPKTAEGWLALTTRVLTDAEEYLNSKKRAP